jgi:GDP-4-dehydro-6-deoxy-D-mannose reductase
VHDDDRELDLCDTSGLNGLLGVEAPSAVYHLAGRVEEPVDSGGRTALMRDTLDATLSLLECLEATGLKPRFLLAGSAAVYGHPARPDGTVMETDPIGPILFYGFVKGAQESMVSTFHRRGAVESVIARAFNLTGPGEGPGFLAGAVVRQVAAGARVIRMGNLDAERDFLDVRDAVEAFELLMLQGDPGGIYNVGSGRAVPAGDRVRDLLQAAGGGFEIEMDDTRRRPFDVPRILADVSRIRSLGWVPRIDPGATLRDLLASP